MPLPNPLGQYRLTRAFLAVVLALLVTMVGTTRADAVSGPVAPPDNWVALMNQRVFGSRLPGSVLSGASRSMTTIQRIAGVGRSVSASAASGAAVLPTQTTGTASKFGGVMKAAGTVVTMAFALDMTYTAFTGGYGDGFGFQGLTGVRSEGLLCDIKKVATGDGCGIRLAPDVLANADIGTAAPPGWVGNPVSAGWWRSCRSASMCPYDAITQSEYILDISGPMQGWPGAYVTTLVGPGSPYALGALSSGVWSPSTGGDLLLYIVKGSGGTSSPPWNLGAVSGGTLPAGASVTLPVGSSLTRIDLWGPLGVAASWYPVGSPDRPADWNADPERWWSTEWLCEDGSSFTQTSGHFHETDAEWPVPVEPTCDGSALSHVKVSELGTGVDPAVLYEWDLPGAASEWAAAYPQCTDGSCILELSRIDPTTGRRLACFDNPALCVDWFDDPAKVDNYVCTYGGQDVALTECNMYAPTFDPARATPGGTFGDPETGETVGTTPLPEADDGCPPPFSWSALWNNWWIFKAVDCGVRSAATALFVPSDMESTFSETVDLWKQGTAYKWGSALSTMFDDVGLNEGGCEGPGGTIFPELGGMDVHLFSACDPPWSDWAPLVKQIAGFMIGLGAFWSCANSLGKGLGYDFGPSPTPEYVQGTLW